MSWRLDRWSLLLIGGLFYFRRMERRFADVA